MLFSCPLRRPRSRHALVAAAAAAAAAVTVLAAPPASAATGHSVREYQVSPLLSEPCNVQGTSSRYMWYIEQEGRRLRRIDLQTGSILTVNLPPATLPVVNLGLGIPGALSAGPCDMALGGDGQLYFNDQYNNSIGFVDPNSPAGVHEIPLPTPASLPMSIATGAMATCTLRKPWRTRSRKST
jgi:streptogramin lyase